MTEFVLQCSPPRAVNGLAFILPIYNGFVYARRAAESFFKYTPTELNPVLMTYDDASPKSFEQDWDAFYSGLPLDRISHLRYPANGGLTRSWNAGLVEARQLGCRYAIAGNSDVLFTRGWSRGLLNCLANGAHLVGPTTNAPGYSHGNSQKQGTARWVKPYQSQNDDADYLNDVADRLWQEHGPDRFVEIDINGFFMLSSVALWWSGAVSNEHVFAPENKMTGNEDELQHRWRKLKRKIGFSPASFVYHYRAVSRGKKFLSTGWNRLKDPHKPV